MFLNHIACLLPVKQALLRKAPVEMLPQFGSRLMVDIEVSGPSSQRHSTVRFLLHANGGCDILNRKRGTNAGFGTP
jgi:hypothetical protein